MNLLLKRNSLPITVYGSFHLRKLSISIKSAIPKNNLLGIRRERRTGEKETVTQVEERLLPVDRWWFIGSRKTYHRAVCRARNLALSPLSLSVAGRATGARHDFAPELSRAFSTLIVSSLVEETSLCYFRDRRSRCLSSTWTCSWTKATRLTRPTYVY